MTMAFIDLDAQQRRIKEDLDRRLAAVLRHGQYILGPEVAELEERLATYVGAKHCISCANGTDALQIALMALGLKPGDEVITPSFSYIAAAEAVALLGGVPVFVDVDEETCLMRAEDIESRITPRTRAIIPVSLYGQCPDMSAICAAAERHGLTVIEDAAQSFGAAQNGKMSCALSKVSTTSFFPSKPLGCYGDGGAMFTDDDDLAVIMRQTARHGQDRRYHHIRIGVNSRLDTIQAAVLLAKLDVFAEDVRLRNVAAEAYGAALAQLPVRLPTLLQGNTCVWAQYTIRCKSRDKVAAALKDAGIPTAIHYPVPLHRQRALECHGSYPNSERLAATVLSLPMHPDLTQAQVDKVAAALRRALA